MRYGLLLTFFPLLLSAQFNLERAYPTVTTGEEALALAWEGGLNSPQPAKADLDGDGREDLFIFERLGSLPLAYRATPNSYEPAPELLAHWPVEKLRGWVLLRDYNQDGVTDIFAYSDTSLADGIIVFRGVRRTDGLLEFERQVWEDDIQVLHFPQQSGARVNIFVSEEDYPEVRDVDCDGDLDILTFNIGGGYVEFFRNTAVEDGGSLEVLNYVLEETCYGGIFEPGLSSAVELANAAGECAQDQFYEPGQSSGGRHAGSTLLSFDEDGDGDMELMLGDISFSDLNLLTNSGDCEEAWFSEQQQFYPGNSTPVNLNFFPAGFYLDFDQDGKRDLMAAPNQKRNAEDRFCLWFYENTGTDDAPTFNYRNDAAMVGEMIDLGTGSFAAALDVDADGDQDLVVSNIDHYSPDFSTNSHLQLFRNIGSGNETVFQPADEDFLGMRAFNNTSFAFAPTFGDIDQDGDTDALIGDSEGKLYFLENTAGPGNPPIWVAPVYEWQDIDVGKFSQPRIVDLDRDGLVDLAIGSRKGSIDFYRNVGSVGNPQFNADIEAAGNILQLGGIDSRAPDFFTGYASPAFVAEGDDWLIFNMTIEGHLAAYRLAHTELEATADTLDAQIGGLDVGEQGTLLMANFDADPELEVVLGSLRGGVSYFNSDITDPTLVSTQEPADRGVEISIFPNPATDRLWLRGDLGGLTQVVLSDVSGRILSRWNFNNISPAENPSLELGDLPTGVYQLRLSGPDWAAVKRVVVR